MPGKWFDELRVGQLFQHETRRTITAFDLVWFASATAQSPGVELGEAFTLGLMAGVAALSVPLEVEIGAGPNWEQAH